MTQVIVTRNSKVAPGLYIVCAVEDDGTWNEYDAERAVLIHTDYDWPSVAIQFGWIPEDGFKDDADLWFGDYITQAGEWLDEHLDEPFMDPGYFA